MQGIPVSAIALAGLLQMSPVPAVAAEQPAPASVALFYDALTGAPGKDVTEPSHASDHTELGILRNQ